MLVLTRRAGERILIETPQGQLIVVKVDELRRDGSVKLCFDADRSIAIVREEIYRGGTKSHDDLDDLDDERIARNIYD